MKHEKTVMLLLRIGVAFAFLYPAVSAYFNPFAWIGYFPAFMFDLGISETLLLHLFGAGEVIVGLWILSGKKIFIPSILAAVGLFLIVAFNIAQMDVVFRDIPIFLMAVLLVILSHKTHGSQVHHEHV